MQRHDMGFGISVILTLFTDFSFVDCDQVELLETQKRELHESYKAITEYVDIRNDPGISNTRG